MTASLRQRSAPSAAPPVLPAAVQHARPALALSCARPGITRSRPTDRQGAPQ
jgi:hypothetical protein